MTKLSSICGILIAFIVSINSKILVIADNADQNNSAAAASSSLKNLNGVVASDNICNNNEKNVAFDVILIDNNKIIHKRETASTHINDGDKLSSKSRPRPDQKSLLIVFDGTGSMHDDLQQLRSGAQEIINDLSSRNDSPIFNYALVVYRDPNVDPPFETHDPEELLEKLATLQVSGGGDCPELALNGLRIALQFALPNSLAYVFSDATAKDYGFYEDVVELIQKKQVTVNFLLTGDCNAQNSYGYQVYHKLSRVSNGQVYDMNKNNVKDVLVAIKHSVSHNYAALKSLDLASSGTSQTNLNIDKSISELSVRISGRNPTLSIRDPSNETVKSGEELSLENLKLVNIKDPKDGLWRIEAGAESAHSVRLSALSDLKFDFGFSGEEISRKSETSVLPLAGSKNILSIFISDPLLVKKLSNVSIILVPLNPSDNEIKFSISLHRVSDKIYATNLFEVPRQMFKIQLYGTDVSDNPIERLISTGLIASSGSSPEVNIEVNRSGIYEGENLILKCLVNSQIPIEVTWIFNGKVLKKKSFNSSNELELKILNAKHQNQGSYKCSATNKIGNESQEIFISILKFPKVKILADEKEMLENIEYSLRCNIENAHGDFSISWYDQSGVLLQNNSSVYKFTAKSEKNDKKISCRIKSDDFLIEDSMTISINYAPKFINKRSVENHVVKFGSDINLDCKTTQKPQVIKIQWKFTTLNDSKILSHNGSELIIHNINENDEGIYECNIQNKVGKNHRNFAVEIEPKAPPILTVNSDILITNETEKIELICECKNCLPITNFTWMSNDENANVENYEKHFIRDVRANSFKAILTIKSADESDSGSFQCRMMNKLGEGNATIELLVQSRAKIESILHGEREIDGKLEVLEGRKLSVECVFDGYPEPSVLWQKDQEKIIEDAILELKNIQENDDGNYECIASNILGVSVRKFELIVNSQPKGNGNHVTTIQAIEGEKVEIFCDLKGKPEPVIYWSFNSKEIRDENFVKNGTKLSFVAKVEDSGIFNCLGVNEHGKTSIDFTVVVLTHPKIINPNDESLKILKEKTLALSCDATGYPQPHIQFVKNNNLISNNSKIQTTINESSIIHCIAENEVGSAEKLFYVTIIEMPKITSKFNDNVTLLTNQTTTIQCHAGGIPEPKITWKYEDESQVSANKFLELSSTSKRGKYFCLAENSEGSDKRALTFNVINKPTLLPIAADLNMSIKIKEHDDLEILCPFTNFNQILWLLNNKSIENLEHHKLIDKKLIIHNVNNLHNGLWTCVVSNTAGTESFSYKVTVHASPTIFASWNLQDRGISDFLITESDIDERVFRQGENLKLNCTSSGSPPPKVIWKKSTDVISEGEILSIENLQFFHSDIYTCTAENGHGSVKKFFKIEVISPPSIDSEIKIQKEFQKVVGDSILLRCSSIIANPPPLFFWFKDNELLDDENEDHLEIDSLELSHDGKYKCLGKNKYGSAKIDFTISMYESATIISAKEEEKLSRNDNSLRLSCLSRGNPLPILSWTLNGHVMSSTSKLNIEKLFKASLHENIIYFDGFGNGITYLDPFEVKLSKQKFYSQLMRVDEKTLKLEMVFKEREKLQDTKFTCYSFNALGRSEKAVVVTINRKPYVKERNRQSSDQIEILEHLPLLLTCLIDGHPQININWFRDGHPIYENDTIKLLNERRILSIPETFSWHSGNYSCVGYNSEGEEELKYFVTILSPPRFSDYSVRSIDSRYHNDKTKIIKNGENEEVIHVLKGEDVILECWIDASPKAKIHWIKLNLFDGSKNEILIEHENVMTINAIQESSNYLCYVNNTLGNIQKFFFIDVQYPPKFIDDKFEERVTVKINHGINFECKVKASPEAAISWSYNSTNITKHVNDYYFSSNNEIMRILSVNKNHEGKFFCTATNDHGSIQKVFYVNVDIPIQFSPWSEWSQCSVSCGLHGIQYRSRTCILLDGHPSYNCSGENIQMRKCNDINCPVNGAYGNFSKWSPACPPCYYEGREKPKQKRYRKCDSPSPAFGGLNCDGVDMEERDCEVNYCPIHGGWSEWSNWSDCSKSCGRGIKMRKRHCNNPPPKFHGKFCDGENVEYEECKEICNNFKLRKDLNNEIYDSEESTERFKEFAEFEMIDNDEGEPKIFQFSQHREIEFQAPPSPHLDSEKLPTIKVTLDTYKPISEETYNRHLVDNNNIEDDYFEPEFLNSDELTSTESTTTIRNCGRGFRYNFNRNHCEEIDECKEINPCRSNEKCVNIIGSYRCEIRNFG